MRRALYIAALLPLTLVSASGAAQLGLPGGGIGLPDVGAPVERVVGALPLSDIAALPPAQAARALLIRQAGERPFNGRQFGHSLHPPVVPIAHMTALFLWRKCLGPPLARPCLIDPDVSHDPVHPAVQPGSIFPQVPAPQGPFDRRLAKIVAIRHIARQARRETAQTRQKRQQFIFKGHSAPILEDETDEFIRLIQATAFFWHPML